MLCGEAVGTSQPAMTHGAFESGERAAHWCLSAGSPGETVVVIGAGLSGLAAARTLVDAGANCIVVEARSRLGGRVHTIELGGGDVTDSRVQTSSTDAAAPRPVTADAGASWLQQFSRNLFAPLAQSLGAHLVPTDFHAPLAAAADGAVGDVDAALDRLEAAARSATGGALGKTADMSLADVVRALPFDARADAQRALNQAIASDVVLETGVGLNETSARWFFGEDGVGRGDHWIREGYRVLVDHFASGLTVSLEERALSIAWNTDGVTVSTDRRTIVADRCICSMPISLLQRGEPVFDPGLPQRHLDALSRLGMGVVEKVILRFDERWWPAPEAGYIRWYDTPTSWGEWLDLTDGAGAAVVAGLIAHDAVARHHHGRTDEEVALAATDALERWATAVRRDMSRRDTSR